MKKKNTIKTLNLHVKTCGLHSVFTTCCSQNKIFINIISICTHTITESWFSNDTDLSLYMIPGYHLISTSHYASTHGGLVMYLNQRWDYNLKTCDTVSKFGGDKSLRLSILM